MNWNRPSRCFCTVLLALVVAAAIAASPVAAQVAEDNPVPKLLENLEADNVQVASSAARSLGVIFAPGGKGGDEAEEVTAALIAKLDSPLGAKLRESPPGRWAA